MSSGGAYEGISVAEARHGTGWLASLGVVAFALRYRLPPKHPWPAARDDVAAAVEFLRSPAAAAKFRVDRDRLVLLGFSAGSHLSAHAPAFGGHCALAASRETLVPGDPLAFEIDASDGRLYLFCCDAAKRAWGKDRDALRAKANDAWRRGVADWPEGEKDAACCAECGCCAKAAECCAKTAGADAGA